MDSKDEELSSKPSLSAFEHAVKANTSTQAKKRLIDFIIFPPKF